MRRMRKSLAECRRRALLAAVLISLFIFLLTLIGNPYVALSRYLFEDAANKRRTVSNSPTIFKYGNDVVTFVHGHHRLYDDRVDRLSDASVRILYRRRASVQITANCSSVAQLGAKTAASWMLCTVGPFRPTPPCLAFAFDASFYWRLEAESIVTQFDCQSLLFDSTMQAAKRQGNSNVIQINQGLLNHPKSTGSLVADTFKGHLKRLKAESLIIDVLEVNIGGSGWQAIETAITDKSLRNVKQLLLAVPLKQNSTVETMRDEIRVVAQLDQFGFRLWRYSMQNRRQLASGFYGQFHFLNQRFGAADDSRARNSKSAVASFRDSLNQLTLKG